MFENIEVYQQILDEIAKESGGQFEDMSYQQKLVIIRIMKEYKKAIDKFMAQEYYKIRCFANLNLEDIQLEEKEPDWSHLYKKDDGFNEQFNKLMGI